MAITEDENGIPAELKDRLRFQAHDFFTLNPVKHADVYLLRSVLHDWPDEDAIGILRNIVPRMGPNTRILINDVVVPSPGMMSMLHEKYTRNLDVMLFSIFNAMGRSLEDWKSLIEKTNSRLNITRVTKPENSAISMMEVMKT